MITIAEKKIVSKNTSQEDSKKVIPINKMNFTLNDSFSNSINVLIISLELLKNATAQEIKLDFRVLSNLVNACANALTYIITLSYHPEYMELSNSGNSKDNVSKLISDLCELALQISNELINHNSEPEQLPKLQNQLELGFKLGLATQFTDDNPEKNVSEINLCLSNIVEIVKRKMSENQCQNQSEWTSRIIDSLFLVGMVGFTIFTGGSGGIVVAVAQGVGHLCYAMKAGLGFYKLYQEKNDFIMKHKDFFFQRIEVFNQLNNYLISKIDNEIRSAKQHKLALAAADELTKINNEQLCELRNLLQDSQNNFTAEEKAEINALINGGTSIETVQLDDSDILILIENCIIECAEELQYLSKKEIEECKDFLQTIELTNSTKLGFRM